MFILQKINSIKSYNTHLVEKMESEAEKLNLLNIYVCAMFVNSDIRLPYSNK